MQRAGNLFPELTSWANLLRACHLAARGKRFRPDVASFLFNGEFELLHLQRDLESRRYRPGPYRSFYIFEPKKRQISAAAFRDRVVHHALCNVIEPLFERGFVSDSYACRKGKCLHAAVGRGQLYLRQYAYVLKSDIRKFFPSIDHQVLKALIARRIKDPDVLWLAGEIIDGSNPQESLLHWFPGDDLFTPTERRRGIPIGNQTSQFFANVYLSPLDHFVKEQLRLPGYVRYVDDFLAFSDDKRELDRAREQIREFAAGLRLQPHVKKSIIFPSSQGVNFLGYRLFPDHRRLCRDNVKRMKRRMQSMQVQYARGEISIEKVTEHIRSWIAHAQHADTYHLREHLLGDFPFCREPGSQDVDESPTEENMPVSAEDELGRHAHDTARDWDWFV